MRFKMLATGLLTLGILVGLAGCGSEQKAQGDSKEKLVVQFVPTNNDGSMEAKTKPFAEYLSEKLDKDVTVTLATDYSTIV